MNRELKEIFEKMKGKLAEIKACTDPEAAKKLNEEYADLKNRYEMKKAAYDAEKDIAKIESSANPLPTYQNIDPQEDSADKKQKMTPEQVNEIVVKQVKAIIREPKELDKDLSETVDEDGGYTVPQDAQTQINQYKKADYSFVDDIVVENVTTLKGQRVYQKKGSPAAFQKLTSDGMLEEDSTSDTSKKSNKMASPKFEIKTYHIEDYAGFMPVPNNLINDSDANILDVVYKWLAEAEQATDNACILSLLGQTGDSGMGTDWRSIDGIDGIKKEINVTLGQAYAGSVVIHTNDDGLNYLDTLKDTNDRPLLNPVPNEPGKCQLTVGFKTIPVKVKPNDVLKSIDATTTAGGKIPFIIGDMKEAIRKYDRQKLAIAASGVAVVGSINAFANNLTILRGIVRADYKIIDAGALVKGYIATPKKS